LLQLNSVNKNNKRTVGLLQEITDGDRTVKRKKRPHYGRSL